MRASSGDAFVVLRNLVCCGLSLDDIMDISQIINYIVTGLSTFQFHNPGDYPGDLVENPGDFNLFEKS